MVDTGFFTYINNTFGANSVYHLKKWMKLNKNLASFRNRRIFLLQCRTKNLIPNHIKSNINCIYSLQTEDHPFQLEGERILKRLRKSILNLEIKITLWKLVRLEQDILQIEQQLNNLLPNDIIQNFKIKIGRSYVKLFESVKTTNIKKLKDLEDKASVISIKSLPTFIHNYTSVQLTPEATRILGAGPKFAIPITGKEVPIPNLIKDIEYCISFHNTTEEHKDIMRCRAVNILSNFYNGVDRWSQYNPIIKDFDKTKQFIKTHPEILICRADKGNSTVIVYKSEYQDSMKEIFSDLSLYKVVNKDPTESFQNKAIKLIKHFEEKKFIDEWRARKMIKYNCVPPKAYGLRKTHKNNIAYRPVISNLNAPSYQLSVFLHEILSQVISTFNNTIKNSYEMVEILKNIRLPKDYVLISLDVISLFPSIPKDLVVNIIRKDWKFISCYTNLPLDEFLNLINFIFNTSYFKFDNIVYEQLDGTAMGNPASPSIANLVMNYITTKILKEFDFEIPFFKLYVDDTLLAIPSAQRNNVLKTFNDFNNRIQFTMEMENINREIPFLDILVIRNSDGTISTSWYNKPSSSGRILNFLSNHPIHQKNNNAKNLIERCNRLSSPEFIKNNLTKIKNLLINNNYPKGYINLLIKNVLNNQKKEQHEIDMTKLCKFPYIKGLSDKIGNLFRKEKQCKLVFYNLKTVSSIFSRIKDRDHSYERSELVYKIDCKDCTMTYIGQTKQRLRKRIQQHKNDCTVKNVNKNNKTALAYHRFEKDHMFDFDNVNILDYECNTYKRNLAEMVFITLHNDTCVNLRTDTNNLSGIYKAVLDCYGHR